jgi:hypothetical protein
LTLDNFGIIGFLFFGRIPVDSSHFSLHFDSILSPKVPKYFILNVLKRSLILDQLAADSFEEECSVLKPRLHDSHFGHGTLKIWHADPFFWARHSSFLSCKRKIKGPRAQNFKRAETSSGGSLGPLKNGSADRKLVTHAFYFSHCKNIVSVYKQNIDGRCVWSDEAVYKSSDIYYGHA